MELEAWIPAFVGIGGGLATYIASWWKDRKNERRYLTKDALEAITIMHNATTLELAEMNRREAECRLALGNMRLELADLRDENFRLHTRILDLEKKTE